MGHFISFVPLLRHLISSLVVGSTVVTTVVGDNRTKTRLGPQAEANWNSRLVCSCRVIVFIYSVPAAFPKMQEQTAADCSLLQLWNILPIRIVHVAVAVWFDS